MKNIYWITLFLLVFNIRFSLGNDSIPGKNSKSGFSFGGVPVIAYDSDIGLKYGALLNIFHYGDGSIYPDYKHSIYLEWSRTTKGSGINQITYDSKYLIPGVRVSGELSYLTEKALDFYGFNGYKSYFNHDYEDDDPANINYQSRVFYRQNRDLLRIRADFSGKLKNEHLGWILGLVHYNIALDTIDLDKLNSDQNENEKLPAINGGLYGLYKEWNIIPENQYYGGQSTLFKTGIVYDSRDNEPNPMKGIWTELLLLVDPGVFGGNSFSYGKYSFVHRQYFTLIPDQLSFAYRLGYQGTLFGTTPSYMLPFVFNAGRYTDLNGLGGSKTIRGILRNRIVGEDMAYGNFELRWKFIRTILFNQNIYLALSAFTDMGMVTREYKINTQDADPNYFPNTNESLHQSLGGGLRVALNENFIVACDYGYALKKDDGDTGLYINLNWLF